jgi:hypothetical protein
VLLINESPAEAAQPFALDDSVMEECVNGALAGLIATAPMTWAMRAAGRLLPWTVSDRLPPRQITESALRKVGGEAASPERLDALATLAHYAYGAAGGAVLGVVVNRSPLPKPLTGALFGLAVWGGSYLGLLPAAGVRKSALNDPKERSLQMIAAHLVWGVTTAALQDELSVEDRRRA